MQIGPEEVLALRPDGSRVVVLKKLVNTPAWKIQRMRLAPKGLDAPEQVEEKTKRGRPRKNQSDADQA